VRVVARRPEISAKSDDGNGAFGRRFCFYALLADAVLTILRREAR
jgi:hypothetical protein